MCGQMDARLGRPPRCVQVTTTRVVCGTVVRLQYTVRAWVQVGIFLFHYTSGFLSEYGSQREKKEYRFLPGAVRAELPNIPMSIQSRASCPEAHPTR